MNTAYVISGGSAQVGELRPALLTANGPTSYNQATGDPVYNPGANEYIAVPFVATTLSGNYDVYFTPSAAGVGNIRAGAPSASQSGWTAHWFFSGQGNPEGVNGVVIATAGTGQTNGTYTANASGGGGSGAQIQYTISGGLLTAVKVLHAGTGYTSAPSFTIAAGGTPGTVTATIGAIGTSEVGTGINLSAEVIQFGAFVTQL